jgi:hypothetical protein
MYKLLFLLIIIIPACTAGLYCVGCNSVKCQLITLIPGEMHNITSICANGTNCYYKLYSNIVTGKLYDISVIDIDRKQLFNASNVGCYSIEGGPYNSSQITTIFSLSKSNTQETTIMYQIDISYKNPFLIRITLMIIVCLVIFCMFCIIWVCMYSILSYRRKKQCLQDILIND